MGRKGGKPPPKIKPGGGSIWADPARIRFAHARIRPYFSGCGRSVMDTLESIRNKEMQPSDLPPIQVLIGPDTEEGPCYFSLNNRRLWVLKRCREEGLLENNLVLVRSRSAKSDAEASRYTIENCALEAKIMKESAPGAGSSSGTASKQRDEDKESTGEAVTNKAADDGTDVEAKASGEARAPLSAQKGGDNAADDHDLASASSDSSDDESDGPPGYSNPFSALS